jgi:ADP-ribose pyrophosphatase YjhB (NUDIX family)
MHLNEPFLFCPQCGCSWEKYDSNVLIGNHIQCASCGFTLYRDPKIAVCAIVAIDDQIIMIRRTLPTNCGEWAIPGGFVDRGETVEAAAVREFKEEVLIDINIKRLIGVYSYVDNPVILIVFEGTTTDSAPRCGDEVSEVAMYNCDQIPWGNLAFPANRDALIAYYQLKGVKPLP